MKSLLLGVALLGLLGAACGGTIDDARDVNGAGASNSDSGAGSSGLVGTGAGDNGGLDTGKYDLDFVVTYNQTSQHLTSCFEVLSAMVEYTDGRRGAFLNCDADYVQGAAWDLDDLSLVFYSATLGQHDASELTSNCDSSANTCVGANLEIAFQVGNYIMWVDSSRASSTSGSYTLDEFTADGRVMGSLDVTMSESGRELNAKGHFTAQLKDCGAVAFASDGDCLGRRN